MSRIVLAVLLLCGGVSAHAATGCAGSVYEDRDGDGRRGAQEAGIPGVRVSDGVGVVATARDGSFRLAPSDGRRIFVIRPAAFDLPTTTDGLPRFWAPPGECPSFGLRRSARRRGDLDVLVVSDPQPKTMQDVGYYARDIVAPLERPDGGRAADLGLTLGDVVADAPALYPAMIAATGRLRTPWLHVPGNHDVDAGATSNATALAGFSSTFGPDTFAWEAPQADFLLLDDVISLPTRRPAYVGGLREDQFAFVAHYLARRDPRRRLVLAVHIPLFPDGGETFRTADRERLFALLKDVPKLLVLSGHGHVQRHVFHDAATGWHGAVPLHEYNVGAACGAYWSGVKDATGVPDATMADGTPNGSAHLQVGAGGDYRLAWRPARIAVSDGPLTPAMRLYAPRVLRRGAYPAWGVYANVWMGTPDLRIEMRVDGGAWQPMKRVEQPDPWLLAENARDDEAPVLRGYDRSPEAQVSTHLWRAALPTSLAVGTHRVEVRAFDPWQGEQRASTAYELQDAAP